MEERTAVVDQIRAFNRFYTVLQGFLDRNYLDSGYSVTETRILFELKQSPQSSASRLIETLHLDKGYISRLIRSLEQKDLLERQVSAGDGRALLIRLTPEGERETDRLIEITNRKIGQLIQPLSAEDCNSLCAAMQTIMEQFSMEGKRNER